MDDLNIGIRLEDEKKSDTPEKPKDYRRKWKRFIVQSGPIVILHYPRLMGLGGEKDIELGPLINISEGGIMVQFIERKDREKRCPTLSIQIPGQGVKIKKVSYEIVRDFEVGKLPDGRKIRNRSIRFLQLTPPQAVQLKAFIKEYTAGQQKDRRSGKDRREIYDPTFAGAESENKIDRRRGPDRRQYPAAKGLKKS